MMKPDEIVAIRQRLEMSQLELAEAMGVNERTVRRWEAEGCPEVIARFLAKLVEDEV